MILRILFSCSLLVLAVGGCKKPADESSTAPKTVEPVPTPTPPPVEPAPAADGFAARRDEAIDKAQVKLRELDAKIAELDAQAKANASATKEATLTKLKAARDETESALKSARESSAEKWDAAKTGVDDALTRLHNAYDAAAKELVK